MLLASALSDRMSEKDPSFSICPFNTIGRAHTRLCTVCATRRMLWIIVLFPELLAPAKIVSGAISRRVSLSADLKCSSVHVFSTAFCSSHVRVQCDYCPREDPSTQGSIA